MTNTSIAKLAPVAALTMGLFFPLFAVEAQSFTDPSTSQTFGQATQGMQAIQNFQFGTGPGKNVTNLNTLANGFNPYGIAGHIVFNGEWDIYQPFNSQNFVFTPNSLNLTATIPAGGGLWVGGINSAQLCSKQTYKPGVTGHAVYAFEVRMKIPDGQGMWPAAWFYTQQPGEDDGSEIDNPEFYVMEYQNQLDWTGFQHGPGQGADLYNMKSNPWTWHPGLNFAADYHDYQTFWTPDAVYKYVDGTLIYAQHYKWTAPGPAQIMVNMAVGGNASSLPGLQPNSLAEFPAHSALQVDHITVWAK